MDQVCNVCIIDQKVPILDQISNSAPVYMFAKLFYL